MINTVKVSAQLGDPDDQRSARQQGEPQPSSSAPAPAPSQPSDIRLVIEHDERRNVMIYKLVDRVTGGVISEVSREELIRMSADPAYQAGKVVDTKA